VNSLPVISQNPTAGICQWRVYWIWSPPCCSYLFTDVSICKMCHHSSYKNTTYSRFATRRNVSA